MFLKWRVGAFLIAVTINRTSSFALIAKEGQQIQTRSGLYDKNIMVFEDACYVSFFILNERNWYIITVKQPGHDYIKRLSKMTDLKNI